MYEYTTRKTGELTAYANNSRTHSDEQIAQIANSIQEFGFTNPILIDEHNGIIAGHGRLMGANKLGMQEVPCIVMSGLTEAQKKAYVIADNQLALNAGWDLDMLRFEIESLDELEFDIGLLGFDDDFMDSLFDESKGISIDDEIEELSLDEIIVKFDKDSITEITSALQDAIKKHAGASIWYNDEQV